MPHSPRSSREAGLCLLAAGCCATLAQVVVLRELLVLAAGSELSAGLNLALWLLATGAGAALGAKASGGQDSLARLLAATAPLLPLAVLGARLTRTLLPVGAGEVVSLPLALAGGLAVVPFCLLAGAVFPTAVASSSIGVAAAYGLEALGAAAGGLTFVLVAGTLFDQLELALGAALLPLAASLLLAGSRRPLAARSLAAPALAAAVLLGLWLGQDRLEAASRAWQWPGWRVAASIDSPYGNLSAARTPRAEGQLDLFTSGLWAFSCPDEQTAEAPLLALLAHPDPERVLVLGLPAPLSLSKILSHPQVRRLTCVELDPALPRLLRRLLPRESSALDDPRLTLRTADPRQWAACAPPASYDVVLLMAPEPRTAAASRLWSEEFFRRLSGLLAPGGLLAFSAHAAPDALGRLETDYLACLARSAQAAGSVFVLPAAGVTFLAAKGGRPPEPPAMAARLASLGLRTKFITPYFLRYELSPLRVAYLEAALAASGARANTDLRPRCFYFNTVLWSGQHAAWLLRLYTGLSALPASVTAPLLALAPLLGLAGLAIGRRPRRQTAALIALAAVGLATMAAQVALLILFQVAHGSLYLQLALLVAAFMAGLGAGAGLGAARPAKGAEIFAVGGLALLAGGLAAGANSLLAAPPWAFALAAGAFGCLGGYLFPALAARLISGPQPAPAAGLAYGAELAGSALGSVAASLFLVPLAGIPATLWAAAGAGLAGALALAWGRS